MKHLPVIDESGDPRTGMSDAVLHEVLSALDRLLQRNEAHAIDLRSLPLTDPDRAELDARLGQGEVQITLTVAGHSLAWETGYPGVWRVQHHDQSGAAVAETVEVTRVPELLISPLEDIAAAKERLARALSQPAEAQGQP